MARNLLLSKNEKVLNFLNDLKLIDIEKTLKNKKQRRYL